ncbi:hypothetical protein P9112_002264 [Eukaryota sp. TZLM1-RC]
MHQTTLTHYYKAVHKKTPSGLTPLAKRKSPQKPDVSSQPKHQSPIIPILRNVLCYAESCSHLFPSCLSRLLRSTLSLDISEFTLLYRLYSRTHNEYSMKRISPPITDSCVVDYQTSMEKLLNCQLLHLKLDLSISQKLAYLTCSELKGLCGLFKISSTKLSKTQMMSHLCNHSNRESITSFISSKSTPSFSSALNMEVDKILGKVVSIPGLFCTLVRQCLLMYFLDESFEIGRLGELSFIDYYPEDQNFGSKCGSFWSSRSDFQQYFDFKLTSSRLNSISMNTELINVIERYLQCIDQNSKRFNQQSTVDVTVVSKFTAFYQSLSGLLKICDKFGTTTNVQYKQLTVELYSTVFMNRRNFRLICTFKKLSKHIMKFIKLLDQQSNYSKEETIKWIRKIVKYFGNDLPSNLAVSLIKHLKLSKVSYSEDLFPSKSLDFLHFEPPVFTILATKPSFDNDVGVKSCYLDSSELCTVEELVLRVFNREFNFNGLHSENFLFPFLFFTLFYDEIFDPSVENSLVHQYLISPLDFRSLLFHHRIGIKSKLVDLRSKTAHQLLSMFDCNYEKLLGKSFEYSSCRAKFSVFDLQSIINCVDGVKLSLIFEYLIKNPLENLSGMPDLVVFQSLDKPNFSGKICFIEVKSELDRLSPQQLCWLKVLHDAGLNVGVAKIKTKGQKVEAFEAKFEDIDSLGL